MKPIIFYYYYARPCRQRRIALEQARECPEAEVDPEQCALPLESQKQPAHRTLAEGEQKSRCCGSHSKTQ